MNSISYEHAASETESHIQASRSSSKVIIFVVFGRPGSGKSTICHEIIKMVNDRPQHQRHQQHQHRHSHPHDHHVICLQNRDIDALRLHHVDLDVCVPEWMRQNFARGIYPTLAERREFAEVAGDYVQHRIDKCINNNELQGMSTWERGEDKLELERDIDSQQKKKHEDMDAQAQTQAQAQARSGTLSQVYAPSPFLAQHSRPDPKPDPKPDPNPKLDPNLNANLDQVHTPPILLVSFSFVNRDLRDNFRLRFPHARWILVNTDECVANQRIAQRKDHFYKPQLQGASQQQQPVASSYKYDDTINASDIQFKNIHGIDLGEENDPNGSHSSRICGSNSSGSSSMASEWKFAEVDFQHIVLDGLKDIHENAQTVLKEIVTTLCFYSPE